MSHAVLRRSPRIVLAVPWLLAGLLGALLTAVPASAQGPGGPPAATRQSAPGQGKATRTATVTDHGKATRTEPVTDHDKAAQAAAALTVWDADDVRGNITLPATGRYGTRVDWQSGDRGIVTPTGEVRRPAHGGKPRAVRLTATVRLGAARVRRTFDLTVRPLPKQEPYEGYLFEYFTGEGRADGEQIHSAVSRGDDPLHWDELNGGKPVLTSTQGDKGVRDPFVIRSPEGDRFFLIATDLKIYGNGNWDAAQRTGSKYLEVWESTDLVHWSDQRHVEVSDDTAGNTWAPEAYWDDSLGAYVVFWASKLYDPADTAHTGDSYNRMMYATTRDFRTFSAPHVWQDPGYSVIDSTVVKEKDTYYRFTKDERNNSSSSPCSKFVIEEKSTRLLAPDWDLVSECIGKGDSAHSGISQGEGPTVFKSNTGDKWYMFIDEFGGRGYVPFETTDLASGHWTMSTGYQLPASPRHGTVLPVTRAESDRLRGVPQPLVADAHGLVASYRLGGDGTRVLDETGHGYDAVVHGDVTRTADAAEFGGVDGHVTLPDNLLTGLDALTVSTEVKIDPGQATPYWLWGLGNSSGGSGDGYLFTTGDGYRTSLASGDWRTEQTVASRALPHGSWHTLTYTLGGGTARLYLDGTEVAHDDAVTLRPGDIGGGRTTANRLGRSLYAADRYFKGAMRGFALWNRALSAAEVRDLPGNRTQITSADLAALKAPAAIDSSAGTVLLPVKPGTDVRRLAPRFGIADDSRIEPASGSVHDFTSPVAYRVRAADGSVRTWTVRAEVMGSPSLPGYNADPNIVRFGDTYYIYATSDGYPGWSGSTFKTWSSKDLVHWTEHPVILDLGPDVSWADSRAWAPAAVEKNGRYYFYFCADAKIGVAVSDSPTGPFVDSGKPLVAANPDGGQAIDPAVFTDDDGRSYLYWGNGNAYVVPLNPDMTSYDPAKIKRLTGLDGFREGLFMHKRAGVYYLSWSIDDTRSEDYRVGYATGANPLMDGLKNHGVILAKDPSLGILGTGHHSVIQVPGTDDWYIAYHRFAIPGGDGTHREVTIDRLRYTPDGLIEKVVPTLTGVRPLRTGTGAR
ncbi:family 43 glycosylhydrolase [Streptomyces sp. NPDC085995]|uniref:family 43 glycosylhydrolase n=1 Tax=Streptomyces sp. NPDC085995 TaxID=3154861 RepID=UPI00344968DB